VATSGLRSRYWRIVSFFGRVTAHVIMWDLVLPRLGLGAWSARTRVARLQGHAVRFRALALAMGGLMIKVGQFLSARFDVFPREMTEVLADLQDEVPAEPLEAVRGRAESELGRPLGEAFASFDVLPLAAASLGQAHRARLGPAEAAEAGFTDVVVKVQRPHIEDLVAVDLAALRRVAGWLRRYPPVAARADPPALIEEFARTCVEELDYLAEGRNAELFAQHFADDDRIVVPRVGWALSTRRVLVLEDVSAIRIGDTAAMASAGVDPAEVAPVLVDCYRRQVLEHGFVHADPHPGNLFVRPSPGGAGPAWQLVFVDFGMVARVPPPLRRGLREAVIAVGTQDAKRLVQAYASLGILLPGADLGRLEAAGRQLFDRFWGMSMSELGSIDADEVARFGHQFRDLLIDLPFQLPQDLLMFGRAVGILSGLATRLEPDFNVWAVVAPYARALVEEDSSGLWRTIRAEGGRLAQVLFGLPRRTDAALAALERGDVAVKMPQLSRQVSFLERSVNRMAGSVAFAGLLVAGALLEAAGRPLGQTLLWASLVPLAWAMFGVRGHRPQR